MNSTLQRPRIDLKKYNYGSWQKGIFAAEVGHCVATKRIAISNT
jgi:hypothetical protein